MTRGDAEARRGCSPQGRLEPRAVCLQSPGAPRCSRTPCSRCFWIFPELYADTRWAFSTVQVPSTGQRPCIPGRKRGPGFCHPVWSPLCCHERRDRLWPGRLLYVKTVRCKLTVRVAVAFACREEGQGGRMKGRKGKGHKPHQEVSVWNKH